jgi:hypothetical protein
LRPATSLWLEDFIMPDKPADAILKKIHYLL